MNSVIQPTSPPPLEMLDEAERDAWRSLTARIGSAIAEPLSQALDTLARLEAGGAHDRQELEAARGSIESARRIGVRCQQLARFESRVSAQTPERLDLAEALHASMAPIGAKMGEAGAVPVKLARGARSVELLLDPSLLYSLCEALRIWAQASARGAIELSVEEGEWPVHGQIVCRFDGPGGPGLLDDASEAPFDSLDWHLLARIAATMQLRVERHLLGGRITLRLGFPYAASNALKGVSTLELTHGDIASLHAKPLSGSQVLVVAVRRDLRLLVLEAIADLGLMIDFVATVAEAAEFCRDGLPHAIVFEAALDGEAMARLMEDVRAELPGFPFIEVQTDGDAFEISGFDGRSRSRVGRAELSAALPSALVFELSKSL